MYFGSLRPPIQRYINPHTVAVKHFQTYLSGDYLKQTKHSKSVEIIRQQTTITTNHLTPKIKLHLIAADARKQRFDFIDVDVEDVFWAFYWPGGQALSRL